MTTTRLHDDTFATSTAGLPECGSEPVVELATATRTTCA